MAGPGRAEAREILTDARPRYSIRSVAAYCRGARYFCPLGVATVRTLRSGDAARSPVKRISGSVGGPWGPAVAAPTGPHLHPTRTSARAMRLSD